MEQIVYDLVGHSAFVFGLVVLAYVLLKETVKERIKKWDSTSSQMTTHEVKCTERYEHIFTKLETICEGQQRIEGTVSGHDKKLETLSTTVATMSGRQEERDRQRSHV